MINKYHTTYLYVLCALFIQGAGAQDLDIYREADVLFYSGEVSWRMDYEAFQPAPAAIKDHKLIGLSDEEFESWVQKQQNSRKQTFQIHALFQGDNLRFECTSEPGDILPMKCDRVLTYNKANTTFIDNALAHLSRVACDVSFRENHYSTFYVPPRACGYDGPRILQMARKVTDRDGKAAVDIKQYEKMNEGNTIVVYGTFSETGETLLAEMRPDSEYGHVFQSIKTINPTFRHIESIECSEFKPYPDGSVFPNKTVVTHYVGGSLNDLESALIIDRITLTVLQAEFDRNIDDELFNPGCPPGYQDLQDYKLIRKKTLTGK